MPETLNWHAQQFYWELKTLSEGLFRLRQDKQGYGRRKSRIERTRLNKTQQELVYRQVADEIQRGQLSEDKKKERLDELSADLLYDIKFGKRNRAAWESKSRKEVPGKPEIINRLLNSTTPEEIIEICDGPLQEVGTLNWLVPTGSILQQSLSKYAAEFIAAKSDRRFPRSMRPTNRLKQLWFLARALSAALHGISTRTVLNLIGGIRPDEMMALSRGSKRKRKSKKASGKDYGKSKT